MTKKQLQLEKARLLAEELSKALQQINGEDRVDILYMLLENYCQHCGSNEGYLCECMNDD